MFCDALVLEVWRRRVLADAMRCAVSGSSWWMRFAKRGHGAERMEVVTRRWGYTSCGVKRARWVVDGDRALLVSDIVARGACAAASCRSSGRLREGDLSGLGHAWHRGSSNSRDGGCGLHPFGRRRGGPVHQRVQLVTKLGAEPGVLLQLGCRRALARVLV